MKHETPPLSSGRASQVGATVTLKAGADDDDPFHTQSGESARGLCVTKIFNGKARGQPACPSRHYY